MNDFDRKEKEINARQFLGKNTLEKEDNWKKLMICDRKKTINRAFVKLDTDKKISSPPFVKKSF